jgi:hypothetical protein
MGVISSLFVFVSENTDGGTSWSIHSTKTKKCQEWTDYTHVFSFAEYMNWLHACILVCRIHELITRMYARLQNTWTVISSCILQMSIHACNHFTYSANEHTCVQSVHVFCKRAYMRAISSCILQASIHACNQFMYSANENTCV